MPGPAIHHIIAREAARKIGRTDPTFSNDMLDGPFSRHLHFGSQGPDFLFFNLKDMSAPVRDFANMYLEVQDFMDDFKKTILEIIPDELKQLAKDLEGVAAESVERSTILTQMKKLLLKSIGILQALQSNVEAATTKYVTDYYNVYDNLLSNAIQDEADTHKWWWFDTLHYRRSGEYCINLLKNSRRRTAERAYAVGYLSHYAADAVGHPYVNMITGGPYRTHSQRHKVVENHHDTYAFMKFFNGAEFIKSKLGEQEYIIGGNDQKLPRELNSLILKSLKETYFKNNISQYGPAIDADDLNDTYRLWLLWFRRSTNVFDLPEPEPVNLSGEIAEAWQRFTNNAGDFADLFADPFSGGFDLFGFLEALAGLILSPFILGALALDFLVGVIETLGAAAIQFFLNYIYEGLYNSYKYFYQGIVLNGLAFPFNEQLNHHSVKHVVNANFKDLRGASAKDLSDKYPFKKFRIFGGESESHLIYPFENTGFSFDRNRIEQSKTQCAPDKYYVQDPFIYINGQLTFLQTHFDFYSSFTERAGGESPNIINSKFQALREMGREGGLGNAIDLTSTLYQDFLARGAAAQIPDLNLDGDRGYGFKCWRKVRSVNDLNDPNASHDVIDIPDSDPGITEDKDVFNILTDVIDPNPQKIFYEHKNNSRANKKA